MEIAELIRYTKYQIPICHSHFGIKTKEKVWYMFSVPHYSNEKEFQIFIIRCLHAYCIEQQKYIYVVT